MAVHKQILEAIQRGINLAIDDFDDDMDIEAQKVGQIKHSSNTREIIKDKYFVDLGLPSGILWGKYNIGVDLRKLNRAQDWYGGYFSWGEIKEKRDFYWETYKYGNGDFNKLTKYCNNANFCDPRYKPDNLTTLQDEDDVAVQTNKLPWEIKMPTKEQIDELMEYTTSEWIEDYQGINNLNGRLFASKTNGNQMFIPAAGFCIGSSINNVGQSCRMWSSSLCLIQSSYAYRLYVNSSDTTLFKSHRYLGFSVRAVLIKQ